MFRSLIFFVGSDKMANSVSQNLIRLQNARTAIANKITSLGGTVSQNDGFEEFPNDLDTIPTGSSSVETVTINGIQSSDWTSYTSHWQSGGNFLDLTGILCGDIISLYGFFRFVTTQYYGTNINANNTIFEITNNNIPFDKTPSINCTIFKGIQSTSYSNYYFYANNMLSCSFDQNNSKIILKNTNTIQVRGSYYSDSVYVNNYYLAGYIEFQ